MSQTDYHIHTTYSDGRNTPEEYIEEAIRKGFTRIGFSDHSCVPFDPYPGVAYDRFSEYKAAIDALKEKYAGKITVYCGMEQDYLSPAPVGQPDYLIGSVHYIHDQGEYFSVDAGPQIVADAIRRLYNRDPYAYAEAYYAQMEDLINRTNADIIGHFDVVTCYQDILHLFDFKHPRYVAAWQKAVDALIPFGRPFEINTRAITKQIRNEPCPSLDILRYIAGHGGKFVLSSDSHGKEELGSHFKEYEEMFYDSLTDPIRN